MTLAKPWLDHYPDEIAPTYEYPKVNIAEFLIQSGTRYPKHPALYFRGKSVLYEELLDSAYRFAGSLSKLGINQGDRVAIMLPNCPQAVIAYFGILMFGAVVVQTNPLYTEPELMHQMSDSGAVAIVTLDTTYPHVQSVQPKTNIRHIIVASINAPQPTMLKGEGVYAFHQLLAEAQGEPVCAVINAEREVALLQYTGGTTGLSKGAMLTHYNLIANSVQTARWFYRTEEGKERLLAALPLFHVFGLTVVMNYAIMHAGMLILVPKFEAGEILQLIDNLKPTQFHGAPTMFIALINHPEVLTYDLSSINICISGSAPLPLGVQETYEKLTGGRLIEGYGLTEASPVTHVNPVWGLRKIGTIGIPFPDTEAKVVDPETGDDLPAGEIGELIVRGPQVMKGYWNREEETLKTVRHGWLYTGDMAQMDEDGYFAIVDRKKDMIIASGYKIYPREVEEVLFKHPLIKEAVAVGVPDPYRGETVKAFIVLKDGAVVTEQEMNEWCRTQLAAFKVPRKFEFRDSLPKTLVGKVLRRKLLEEEQLRNT